MDQKAKILVIDDDRDVQDFCRIVLEKEGFAVEVASTGAEGRAAMTAGGADLVILDVMMEEVDAGLKTAHWFAEHHPKVPVIIFSSIAAAADQVFDTSTLKVADLVNKPIEPKDLIGKVDKLLKSKK
ncbi:MAG: response regulator [Polyangia bacterium]|nr:response regulator [Polyangia bacterium]